MRFESWLNSLRFSRHQHQRRKTQLLTGPKIAAGMESLEDRLLLSAVSGWAFDVDGTTAGGAHRAIDVDADGNVYLLTLFRGTVDFDPGPGTYELTARDPGSTAGDGAIAKYTPDGELIWARRFGGDNGDRVDDVELDGSGNVYITGIAFETSTVDFGDITLSHSGKADAYVAKLDVNGTFLWAHSYGGASADFAYDVSVNDAGDVIAAGAFSGQVDFDADPDNDVILTSAGDRDAVVWKLDTHGDFQWARSFGGSARDEAFRAATDAGGNVYVTGPFQETVNFGTDTDPVLLTSASSNPDTYLLKLDAAGNTTWARQVSGPGTVGFSRLTVSANGAIYTAGSFDGRANFVGQATTLTSAAGKDAYIARWNADGTLMWAGQFAGTSDVIPQRLETDAHDHVYVAGRFKGTADFDPDSAGAFELTAPNGFFDGALVELDAAGSLVRAFHATGPDHVRTADVAVAADGSIYSIGAFLASVTVPTGDVLTSSTGLDDTWVNKMIFAPGITVSPTSGLETTEDGGTAAFDVVLDTQPTADVTIAVSSSDTTEGTVDVSTLTFTPTNWDAPQTVTVTGVDDPETDGTIDYTIVLGPATSADAGYDGIDPADVAAMNLDDDQAVTGVSVTGIDPNSASPGQQVSVTVTGSGFVDGASLSFTNGSGPSPSVSNVQVAADGASLTATVDVHKKAKAVSWEVVVTNFDGTSGTLSDGFTVTAGLLAETTGDGSGVTPLSQADAESFVAYAIQLWIDATGVTVTSVPEVNVADLPGNLLGAASGNVITLDTDAAGIGWFNDATPEDAVEFELGDPAALNHYDLLTAAAHEVGHVFNFDHSHDHDDVMAETLSVGTRRLPVEDHDSLPSTSTELTQVLVLDTIELETEEPEVKPVVIPLISPTDEDDKAPIMEASQDQIAEAATAIAFSVDEEDDVDTLFARFDSDLAEMLLMA